MAMHESPGSLSVLAASLDQSTREIDRTFAGVGDQLGQGLTIVETLHARLEAMSGELAGADMDTTRDALLGVAGDLRAFSAGLPDETRILQGILTQGVTASQAFARLLDHIRLITVVARSARIEAALVQTSQRGFGDFFDEIVVLSNQAKDTIESSTRDHRRLRGLLASALAKQTAFERDHGAVLRTLADKLEWTLGQIEERRAESVSMTAKAAVQSRKMEGAAGGAIVALQSGDSIRQRLEHALTTLRLAGTDSDAMSSEISGWLPEHGPVLDAMLRRLAAAQLDETAGTLTRDVGEIEAALESLAGDTAITVEVSQALYGHGETEAASFLGVLEAELRQASDLLGKCHAARSVVDEVKAALATFLQHCEQTSEILTETVGNIVLIGINSGLRAARRGNEGRGLVVIAHELKSTADRIAQDARELAPAFNSMQAATAELTAGDLGGSHRLSAIRDTMETSLARMRESGALLRSTLAGLLSDGKQFAALVDEARLSFSNTAATADAILAAAILLKSHTAGSSDLAAAQVLKPYLDRKVLAIYTMTAERRSYDAVMREAGWLDAAPRLVGPSGRAAPAAAEEADAFLF